MVSSLRKRRSGFTLVEIMMVTGIIGIIIAIATTTWRRQREISRARVCQENLSKIDGAKEQYAFNNNLPGSVTPDMDDLVGRTLYIKKEPVCPAGGSYTLNAINNSPTCNYTLPAFLQNEKYAHEVP